jgi:hypothetical protein
MGRLQARTQNLTDAAGKVIAIPVAHLLPLPDFFHLKRSAILVMSLA